MIQVNSGSPEALGLAGIARASHAGRAMPCQIVPIAQDHIPSFRAAVDLVARERKYLTLFEAPPLAETTRFVLENIERGHPQFVVLSADTPLAGAT